MGENASLLWRVPDYDQIVDRHAIAILSKPVDLAVRNGDLALTRWGDLMLNDEDYSAYFRFVQRWRFNYPTQRNLFETVFDDTRKQNLERQREELPRHDFMDALRAGKLAFGPTDPEEWHRLNDEIGATEVAKGLYAGAVAVFLSRSLMSFQGDIAANAQEWAAARPHFGGRSLGEILTATANNVRHHDEWQAARPPTPIQLKSMAVLADVLNEPILGDGANHLFGREVAPETLKVLSDGAFDQLERNVFEFTNDLIRLRQQRLPGPT